MNQKKSNKFEVLILVDNFSLELVPLTSASDKSWVFRYTDLCLEWVTLLESSKVIVAFANQSEGIQKQLHDKWSKSFENIQIINVPGCHSINDVLREIQNRGVINNDFLLVYNCATFYSSNLAMQVENFRLKRRQNKNMIATLLYTEAKEQETKRDDGICQQQPLIGFEATTHKLVHYGSTSKNGKVRIPKTFFLTETAFRTDLSPTGLWLCSHEFSGHFAGNHDFHTLDDILQDILSNEEFLGQQIHVDIIRDQKILRTKDNFSALFNKVHAGSSQEDEEESEEEDEEKEESVDVIYQGNNTAFTTEVFESMQELLEATEGGQGNQRKPVTQGQLEKLKLEISASKLAYNISMEDLPRLVFLAFLDLPGVGESQRLATFTELFKEWSIIWSFYFRKRTAKIGMLHAIEEFAAQFGAFRRLVPNILHWLNQDQEFIDDDQIVAWHSSLAPDSPLLGLPKLTEFVQWLQEEEEDED